MKPARLILAASILVLATSAHAGDVVKLSNTTALNDPASWSGGSVPSSGDNAVWNSTLPAAVTAPLGGDTTWAGIKLNGATGKMTIANASSANTLTIGANGIDFTGTASSTTNGMVIQSKILLGANQTWNVLDTFNTNPGVNGGNANEDLAFVAQVSSSSFNLGGFTLTKTGNGTVFVGTGYDITNGSIDIQAGAMHFQSGSSRTITSGAAITVQSGAIFRLQANSGLLALGTAENTAIQSGTVNLNSGATLNLCGTGSNKTALVSGTVNVLGTTTISTSDPLGGTSAGATKVSGGIQGNGTLTLSSTSTNTTAEISGAISDNGGALSLTKLGGKTYTLSGVNTYTGNTTVNAGTLALASTGQLKFVIGASGTNNTVLGAVGGTEAFTINGTFNFDLSGATANPTDSWSIVDVTNLAATFGPTFVVNGFTQQPDNTTWTNGTYQFSETTGNLTVVPEPGAIVSLVGGMGMLLGLRRRRA